jgi:hypothetical protein
MPSSNKSTWQGQQGAGHYNEHLNLIRVNHRLPSLQNLDPSRFLSTREHNCRVSPAHCRHPNCFCFHAAQTSPQLKSRRSRDEHGEAGRVPAAEDAREHNKRLGPSHHQWNRRARGGWRQHTKSSSNSTPMMTVMATPGARHMVCRDPESPPPPRTAVLTTPIHC